MTRFEFVTEQYGSPATGVAMPVVPSSWTGEEVMGQCPDPSGYREIVGRAVGAIGSNALDEAVLGRWVTVAGRHEPCADDVCARLALGHPDAYAFRVELDAGMGGCFEKPGVLPGPAPNSSCLAPAPRSGPCPRRAPFLGVRTRQLTGPRPGRCWNPARTAPSIPSSFGRWWRQSAATHSMANAVG